MYAASSHFKRSEPPSRLGHVPRSRRQRLELIPPAGISTELSASSRARWRRCSRTRLPRDALAAAPAPVRDSLPLVFAASDFVAQACARDPRCSRDCCTAGTSSAASPRRTTWRAPRARPRRRRFPRREFQAQLRRWRRSSTCALRGAIWPAGRSPRDAGRAHRLRGCGDHHGAAHGHAGRSSRATASRARRPGNAQPLVVVGMGKLGGGELNFSSDVDLVLAVPGARRDRRRAAASPTRSSSRAWGRR